MNAKYTVRTVVTIVPSSMSLFSSIPFTKKDISATNTETMMTIQNK